MRRHCLRVNQISPHRRSISTRTRRLFDGVAVWSRRPQFGRPCPPPTSDESTLNETWSSCRRRASGLLSEGSNCRSDNLCKWPSSPSSSARERYDAIDTIIKRQEGPSTGLNWSIHTQVFQGIQGRRREGLQRVRGASSPARRVQRVPHCVEIKSRGSSHRSSACSMAWWCCSVMCVRVMCTCAPYWKTPSGAGKSVASSALVYATQRGGHRAGVASMAWRTTH